MAQVDLVNFQSEEQAYRFVERCVWSRGPVCPRCRCTGRTALLRGATTRSGIYKCYGCRRMFSVKTGTIFQSSNVPMHKWLQALYITGCGSIDIRPHQLAGILNVSFRTSAAMLAKIRTAKRHDL